MENGSPYNIIKDTRYVGRGLALQVLSTGVYAVGINANQVRRGARPTDKKLYNSELGTPVITDISFPAFSWTDPVTGFVTDVPEFRSPSCLITVNLQKVIVKTPIQGLGGTVKEYIYTGDSNITIEGVITNQSGIHPFDAVNALKKLIDAPIAISVVSRYLQNLDIETLVIESAEIGQEEGGYSYQKFKLYCVTDIPVELNIISSSNTSA